LPTGGYYTLRTSWTDPQCLYFFMDVSRQPVVSHQDFDALHIDLFAYGRDFFPDKGTYTYGGASHKAAKATKNHTTVTIDGQNQLDVPAQCHAFFSSPELSFLDGSQPGYKGITHRRQVLFVRPAEGVQPYFVVIDRIAGGDQHTVDQYFHFCPGELLLEEDGASVRTNFQTGANLRIVQLAPKNLEATLIETEMHPRQGKTEMRPGIRFRQATRLPAHFVTLLIPYAGSTPPALTARLVANSKDTPVRHGPDAIEIVVEQTGVQDTLFAALEPQPVAAANHPPARAGLERQLGSARQQSFVPD
jgi:hypothetical protein